MRYPFDARLRERLTENLARLDVRRLQAAALRRAAVAVVVAPAETGAGATVLLTRRTDHLRRHGGQFALPGGRMDQGETEIETALRETHEELGLALGPDAVLGRLDDFVTRSGFHMTPIVVWGGTAAATLAPDANEVHRVYRIPLTELDSPAIPHLRPGDNPEMPLLSAPLPTVGGHVHAPTAALLYQFREVAMRGHPTRVSHFDQPLFARK